jgi:hypothetical protein
MRGFFWSKKWCCHRPISGRQLKQKPHCTAQHTAIHCMWSIAQSAQAIERSKKNANRGSRFLFKILVPYWGTRNFQVSASIFAWVLVASTRSMARWACALASASLPASKAFLAALIAFSAVVHWYPVSVATCLKAASASWICSAVVPFPATTQGAAQHSTVASVDLNTVISAPYFRAAGPLNSSPLDI